MSTNQARAECFIEILGPPSKEEALPEWIECYVIENVEPKSCGPLARDLNAVLPLRKDGISSSSFPETGHLKRIRRRAASKSEAAGENLVTNDRDNASSVRDGEKSSRKSQTIEPVNENPPKPSKSNKRSKHKHHNSAWSLDILVGSVAAVEHSTKAAAIDPTASLPLSSVLETYRPQFTRRSLPGRPAHTKRELGQWNASVWPTLFFEEKTAQYQEEQRALTPEEVTMMKEGMEEALKDAHAGKQQHDEWKGTCNEEETGETPHITGAVVMDPLLASIVSRASDERQLQRSVPQNTAASAETQSESTVFFPDEQNPLCTPVLLAIQGVSRRERTAALGCGMESSEFQKGQYLCTGCDVYLTKEPSIYEAMALVHSRVRRVVFGVQDSGMGGLGGAAAAASNGTAYRQSAGIHSLPGTNHHYRAFRLDMQNSSDDERTMALTASLKELHF